MNFHRANIDRAIVMTQYDLRGFSRPAMTRLDYKESAKALDSTTSNFVAFAAGLGLPTPPTDERYTEYRDSSFDDYLAMCRRLVRDCDESQKEAIQLIVVEIVKQNREMTAEVAAGTRDAFGLQPLVKGNRWGNAVLALVEAFDVKLEPPPV